jgi:hypothetical protein
MGPPRGQIWPRSASTLARCPPPCPAITLCWCRYPWAVPDCFPSPSSSHVALCPLLRSSPCSAGSLEDYFLRIKRSQSSLKSSRSSVQVIPRFLVQGSGFDAPEEKENPRQNPGPHPGNLAGFGRTGTDSLRTALIQLGYRTHHMVEVLDSAEEGEVILPQMLSFLTPFSKHSDGQWCR